MVKISHECYCFTVKYIRMMSSGGDGEADETEADDAEQEDKP